MNLYFMRHGIAVDRAESGQRSADRNRQLTPKGIKRINKAAKGLVALSLSFDRILTSPFERARQTAKIVAQTLEIADRLEEIPQLGADQSIQELLSGLAGYATDKEILLVGHEPLLSKTVSFLLAGTVGAEIRLKKGGLCCLEVDGVPAKKRAVLHWALTPKQLRLLAH
jgi:phosphohistidine phosphatase